jgi:hypothetical protein
MSEPLNKKQLFCSRPFLHLDVTTPWDLAAAPQGRGTAWLCCPKWMPVSIGNVRTSPVQDVWNGETARKLRRSILDGSFRYCTKQCPFLQTESGPVQTVSSVTNRRMRDIIENQRDVVPEGPEMLNAAFDRSCNLSCPSCRTEHIIEAESQSQIEELQRRLENETFDNLRTLFITGSGDAFGSPFFLRWLRTLDVAKHPKLKIHVQTNAQLWTPQIWAKIPLAVQWRMSTAEISIDAASAPTYAVNRRGGEWSTLLDNLEFIAGLRADGPLTFLQLSMVVQENNFAEIPAFVDLGKRFGVDRVFFTHLTSWDTFSPEELQRRSVHVPSHKSHQDLLAVLRDPRLEDPSVDMGNLTSLRACAGHVDPQPVAAV